MEIVRTQRMADGGRGCSAVSRQYEFARCENHRRDLLGLVARCGDTALIL